MDTARRNFLAMAGAAAPLVLVRVTNLRKVV
jgi:hypothetical protein